MPRTRAETKPAADPIAAIEAEIAALEAKKAALTERLPTLEAAKADALARRREALIDGAGTQAEADAHRAVRDAESDLEAVADALAEIEQCLAKAAEMVDRLRRQRKCDAIATELERDCKAVDTAARQAREALAAIAGAKDALTKAITPLIAAQSDMGWRAPPERVATILLGHLVAVGLPSLKIATRTTSGMIGREIEPRPEHATDPIGGLLTDRLRTLAADIRAGTASPDIAGLVEPEPNEPDFEPVSAQQLVYVVKSFGYRDEHDQRAIVPIGRRCLPKALTILAIERGFASEHVPRDWHPAAQNDGPPGLTGGSPASQPDIGFSLKAWIEAETEKARAAWRAKRSKAAA